VLLDDKLVTTVDCGAPPERFKDLVEDEALPDQLLFDTGPLQDGEHSLTVILKEQYAPDTGCGAGIEAFDYLEGCQTCSGDSRGHRYQTFLQKQLDKFSEL